MYTNANGRWGAAPPNAAESCFGSSRATEPARRIGVSASIAANAQQITATLPLHELFASGTAAAMQMIARACPHSITPMAAIHKKCVGARTTARDDVASKTTAGNKRTRSENRILLCDHSRASRSFRRGGSMKKLILIVCCFALPFKRGGTL